MSHENPLFRPLVEACADHGIPRSTAFELVKKGMLETFTLGARRYVYLASLHSLPERMKAQGGAT